MIESNNNITLLQNELRNLRAGVQDLQTKNNINKEYLLAERSMLNLTRQLNTFLSLVR